MKIGIETLFQLLLLCLAMFCLIGVIGLNQYILDARSNLHHVIHEIECSENREAEYLACVKEVREKGYELSRELFDPAHPQWMLLTLTYTIGKEGNGLYKGAIQGYAC